MNLTVPALSTASDDGTVDSASRDADVSRDAVVADAAVEDMKREIDELRAELSQAHSQVTQVIASGGGVDDGVAVGAGGGGEGGLEQPGGRGVYLET